MGGKDRRALAVIILCVPRSQLDHLREAETSNGAWAALARVRDSAGPVRGVTLYRQLHRVRKGPVTSVS